MMRLSALDLVSDAVSHDAVIERSIHESISLYVMRIQGPRPDRLGLKCYLALGGTRVVGGGGESRVLGRTLLVSARAWGTGT